MSARKPRNTKNKPARKKLTLSKETLRDLTTRSDNEAVRGAACGNTLPPTACLACK